jgi:[ribosomal protein S5]-alanine N-acetyltransferase
METKRCFLHTFQESDESEVKELYRDQEVRKYLGGLRKASSIEETLRAMHHSGENSFYWVVREKQTGSFMGLVSLDSHHESIHPEVSYQFSPEWWGQGFATEVVQEVVNAALYGRKVTKIVAETQIANKASCRLLEKVGMSVERIVKRFGAEQAIYSMEAIKKG